MHDELLDPIMTFFTDEAILISQDVLTHKTTGIRVVKILKP
jgi:hypothetical protein